MSCHTSCCLYFTLMDPSNVCLCMYVCIYVFIYVRTYVYMYFYMNACKYTYLCVVVCVCVCVCVRMHSYMYICIHCLVKRDPAPTISGLAVTPALAPFSSIQFSSVPFSSVQFSSVQFSSVPLSVSLHPRSLPLIFLLHCAYIQRPASEAVNFQKAVLFQTTHSFLARLTTASSTRYHIHRPERWRLHWSSVCWPHCDATFGRSCVVELSVHYVRRSLQPLSQRMRNKACS